MLVFILKSLSRLPLDVLYMVSNLLCFTLNHVLKYRKQIVRENLRNSFPNFSEDRIEQITNQFYRHLADISVETLKLYRLSDNEVKKRVAFINPEVLEKHQANKRGVIIMMGHSGNWEWAGAATALHFTFDTLPVYRKLKNSAMDDYFKSLRSRHGAKPVPDKEISKHLLQKNKEVAVAMLADQTPSSRKGWWLSFLNQDTPFFRGSEILASRHKQMAVVFAHVNRASRGKYSVLLEDAPENWRINQYQLTRSFAKFLETQILKDPSNWLWSHRRWKPKPRANSHFID